MLPLLVARGARSAFAGLLALAKGVVCSVQLCQLCLGARITACLCPSPELSFLSVVCGGCAGACFW